VKMDKLWAPWRAKFITSKKQKNCIFCAASRKKNQSLIFKTTSSICMLNIFPYNNGHLMVAPKRHLKDTRELNDSEVLDLMRAVDRAKSLLDKTLKPQGYNVGINHSAEAGAGITGHLHIHIVPRWKGDVNFMPVIFGTKVISQSLKEVARVLKNVSAKL